MAGRTENLKPWKPGQSGNPAGRPKGSPNLSTRIQDVLNDPDFEVYLQHPTKGYVPFKGTPMAAILITAVTKAAAGDEKSREWLAKYGYGHKIDVTSDGERVGFLGYVLPQPQLESEV